MESVTLSETSSTPSRRHLAVLAILVEGGMFVLGIFMAWLFGPPIDLSGQITVATLVWGTLIALVLIAAVVGNLESPWGRNSRFRYDVENFVHLFQNLHPVDFLWISLLAGLGEEVLFRGLLMHHAVSWFGIPLGIAFSSLIFGLAHALSLSYVVFATLFGILLSGVYLYTGNLILPIIIHAAYDLFALLHLRYLLKPTVTHAP